MLRLDVELLAGGRAQVKFEPVIDAGHLQDPNALCEPAAALGEFYCEAVQKGHRIELRLTGQTDAAAIGEWHVGVVDPFGAQSSGLASLQFFARRRNARRRLCIGEGVLALHRESVSFAVPQQPFLALAIALHVLRRSPGTVLPDDLRELGALKQADLRGGVARSTGADRVGLQHQHVLAGAGQQYRGDETGDPGADHRHVGESLTIREGA